MDIGTLKAQIEANNRQFKAAITDMKKELKSTGNEAKNTGKDFDQLNNALSALGAGTAFYGINRAIKATIDEANRMQMAMQGLIEVTKSLNGDVEASTRLAQELADKGFLSVAEAADAVKTSLAMGLGLEETEKLILALGDAAAYNRESHLQWGEAVVQAIRGIKMGESTLTDAAGITTNLSVMYEQYAEQIGKSAAKLTEAEKVQAAYNGMMKEAALFSGNAETALDGYQGSVARFNNSMSQLKAEIGEAFMPIVADTLEAITPIVVELAKWASENETLVVTIGGVSLGVTGLISVLTAGAFAFNTIKTAAIGFQLSIGPVGWALAGISLAATGLTVAYSKMADETREAELAQEQYSIAVEQSASNATNLAREYDSLSEKLKTLNQNTEEAKATKERMAEIMDELQRISPNLVNQYNQQAGAITNVANSFSVARKEAIDYAKALLQAKIGSANIRLGHVQEDLQNNDDFLPFNRRKLRQEQTAINEEIANYEKQLRAVNQIEEAYKKASTNTYTPPTTSGGGGSGDGGVTTKGGGSSKSAYQQSTEDLHREQYQESLRWIQYKKALNELSIEEELAAYERLLNRYRQYNDIRMDMEERIHQTKGVMVQNSFEHSEEWIEKEEMRMRLSGQTDQEVAQMKIEAWERVRSRYEENTEYYKRADKEIYNLRIQMMRDEQKAREEFERERERSFNELIRNITDVIKKSERTELDSIRKRKDVDIQSIRDREKAELESLDRRRREIADFYDSQLEDIDEQERAKTKEELLAEIEKYSPAVSKEGREKLKELQKRLQDMERQEHRNHLRKQKEELMRNLDNQERAIRDNYDAKERSAREHYDNVYERTQEHYAELLENVQNYTGDVIGLEELIANSRISLNADANNTILSQTSSFVDEYNNLIRQMEQDYGVKTSGTTLGVGHEGWDEFAKTSDENTSWTYTPGEGFKWEKHHTGGIAGIGNFAMADMLMPDEIHAILQQGEIILQPGQLHSLISAVNSQNSGQTIQHNYNAPLFEHSGDVHLGDDADIRGWTNETERLVNRLRANGKKGGI